MIPIIILWDKTGRKDWSPSSHIRSEKDCVDFTYLEHEHSIFEGLTLELSKVVLLDN